MMYAKCGGIVGGGGTINTILISNCIFHSSHTKSLEEIKSKYQILEIVTNIIHLLDEKHTAS